MLAPLLLLTACDPLGPGPGADDVPLAQGVGALRIDRTELDFGTLDVLTEGEAEQGFTATNVGDGALVVAGLSWVVGSEAFTSDAPALVELSPNESLDVTVRFAPDSDGMERALLFPNGAIRVDLAGVGEAPVARVVPDTITFDPLAVGCGADADVVLLNDGSLPLEIDGISLAGSADFSLPFSWPDVLDPGAQAALRVHFAPTVGGSQAASVQVASNDPAAPVVDLAVSGLGVPGGRVVETFPNLPGTQADLLFVIDPSPQMTSRLTAAQQDTETLFEILDAGRVDWFVAVTSPSASCYTTVDPYLHAGLYRNYEPALPALALAYGLNPGLDTVSPTLLQTASSTLDRTDLGECLEGFLRPNTQLHVVLITDRPEASPDGTAIYLDAITGRLADPQDLVVSAVTGAGGRCADGGKAREAAQLTGGATLDLCEQEWGDIFEALARVSVSSADGMTTYPLEERPVIATLEVRYGGRALGAWSYDPDANTITVDGAADDVPLGETITVEYLLASVCD